MPSFACPHCSKTIRAPEEARGRRARCPHCRLPITVPVAPPLARLLPSGPTARALTVECPCGERFGVPRGLVMQEVTCPQCQRTLRVEARPAAAPGPAVGPSPPVGSAAVVPPPPRGAADGLRLAEPPLTLGPERPAAERPPAGPVAPCPACRQPVPVEALLCTHCGTNLRTGRRQMTKVRVGVAQEADEIRSWVSGVSLILPLAIVPYRTMAGGRARWANVGLVGLTIAASIVALVLSLGQNEQPMRYALWPGPRFAPEQLVTHLFLHGGLEHLVGNMVFLWVFGAAVNGALGSVVYPLVYLALGALAGYCGHVLPAPPGEAIPLIGASGAICALSGVYLVLFPRHDIHMAVWFRFAWWTRVHIKTFAVTGVYAVLFFTAFDVAAVVLGWTGEVAHWVHLAGLGWGVALGLGLLLSGAVRSQGYDLLTWVLGDRWRRGGEPINPQ